MKSHDVVKRDRVKIHISKLIGRVQLKEKPDKVYEERKKILGSDPALLKLYKELVTTGMVLPEEFWSLRSNLIVSTHKQQGKFFPFSMYNNSKRNHLLFLKFQTVVFPLSPRIFKTLVSPATSYPSSGPKVTVQIRFPFR